MKKVTLNIYFALSSLLASAVIFAATSGPPLPNILRDPTKPPAKIFKVETVNMNEPLKLTAIFIYPRYRLAIVNSSVLKTGDSIGGFTITNINPYSVELTGPQNNKQVLELLPQVKQKSNKEVR